MDSRLVLVSNQDSTRKTSDTRRRSSSHTARHRDIQTSIETKKAHDLLEQGIYRFRQNDSSSNSVARILIGAAVNIFSEAGDTFNASIARQWLRIAKANTNLDQVSS